MSEALDTLEFYPPEAQVEDYLRTAYQVIDGLCDSGIITIEQAEEARMERFDWAHDNLGGNDGER